MAPSGMIFIDGENLLLRYEAMLADGRKLNSDSPIQHKKGEFVWSHNATQSINVDIVRASYYTSHVGDADSVQNLEKLIAGLSCYSGLTKTSVLLNPHVFKKAARERKSRSVDINITIDVLRHCYQKDIGAAVIISGDGDYIPLVKEAMKTGTRVYVGALSSGLNAALPLVCDQFWMLDAHFFRPAQ